MRQFTRVSALVVWVCGIFFASCGGTPTSPSNPSVTKVADITVLPGLDEMIAEKVAGGPTAPNTVIVYSSFTCPHCADFHLQTYPQLKSKYIDAGKVRYVFRDFRRNDVDVRAAMLARCAGAHYFEAVDTLFRTQSSWASAGDPNQALAGVMRQFGMTQQVIDACVATSALADAIVKMHDDGASQGVSGTPTFFVNGDMIIGEVPLATIEAHLH